MHNIPVPSVATAPSFQGREVIVTLAGDAYSIPFERVLAILPNSALVRFNWRPTFVVGMCFPPGLTAPVLDLRLKYSLRGAYAANAMIVVARAAPRGRTVPIGFLFDEVEASTSHAIHSPPPPVASTESCIPCLARTGNRFPGLDLDVVADPSAGDRPSTNTRATTVAA